MHYNFIADLLAAKEKELELARLLKSRGKTKSVELNNDKRYDLLLHLKNGSTQTIELKHDMLCEKTGNIGVEFSSWGKPSGIQATKADFWCFALYDGFWIIPTDRLSALIEDFAFFRVASGGDKGSDTQMYLFKEDMLKRFMRKLS
jgi:hypothetical protein